MERRNLLKASGLAALALVVGKQATAQSADDQTQASFDTVMAFMGAMGAGDQAKVAELMAHDMVWQNEGDTRLPWIGTWEGKEKIFEFMGYFGENFQTTAWENTDAFASGDTVAVFGKMNGITTKSGKETGSFTFALRAKVRDSKVVLWNWFEDSFALSQAYHG
ncbi:MAG: nuclear transport factor 2 family protein [Cognatishimia sp.]